MRKFAIILTPLLLLAGCSQQQLQKEESWEVLVMPEGKGIYNIEGRFIERELDSKGDEQSQSSLDMPGIRFRLKDEGGIAEFGGEGYGSTTEIQVQSRDNQRSVNYFMEWYRGAKKRSTRGTILLED